MSEIPVLETARLILRGFRPSDREPFMAALGKDEFAATITREGRALDRAEAWRACAVINGSWSLDGFGNWLVERKDSGEPIGRVGPISPPGWPGFEIGWAIFPEHQRQGFATEAAVAAMIWSHDVLGKDEVIHLIVESNLASLAVARALGAECGDTWTAPSGKEVHIWRTAWDRFVASAAYQRHVAASGVSA